MVKETNQEMIDRYKPGSVTFFQCPAVKVNQVNGRGIMDRYRESV